MLLVRSFHGDREAPQAGAARALLLRPLEAGDRVANEELVAASIVQQGAERALDR